MRKICTRVSCWSSYLSFFVLLIGKTEMTMPYRDREWPFFCCQLTDMQLNWSSLCKLYVFTVAVLHYKKSWGSNKFLYHYFQPESNGNVITPENNISKDAACEIKDSPTALLQLNSDFKEEQVWHDAFMFLKLIWGGYKCTALLEVKTLTSPFSPCSLLMEFNELWFSWNFDILYVLVFRACCVLVSFVILMTLLFLLHLSSSAGLMLNISNVVQEDGDFILAGAEEKV